MGWRRAGTVLVTGALVAAVAWVAAPAAAQPVVVSRAVLDPDPDAGLVAAGHLVFIDPQPVRSAGEVAFKLGPADGEYVLEFSGPVGQPLRVGTYEHAGRMNFRDPGQPGLELSGRGVGCNEIDGRFVVDDITRDAASTVISFAAQFEIHCPYGDGGVFGTISYHSAIAYPERSISPAHLVFAATIGDRTASQRVVVTNTGPITLTEARPSIDGPQASDFRVAATTCGGPLPPGQSCTLDVDFAPTALIDPDARYEPHLAAVRIHDELAPAAGAGRRVPLIATAYTSAWYAVAGTYASGPALRLTAAGNMFFANDRSGSPRLGVQLDREWSTGYSLGGILTTEAVPAVNAGGRPTEVLGVGLDGALWANAVSGITQWSGWRSLGGRLTSTPAAAQLDDTTFAFGVGLDGALWCQRIVRGVPAGWSSLGGIVVGDPTVVVESGVVHVVVVGVDGGLWTRSLAGTTWTAWAALGGRVVASPTGLSTAGAGYVFDIGGDGAVWYRSVAGGRWTPWASLGGRTGSRIAASVQDSGPVVAVIGTDGAIWTRQSDGAVWRDWRWLGGSFHGGQVAADRQQVVARNAGGSLWERRLPIP